MSTGEFPGQLPGEAGINPRSEVRDRCIEEVQQGLTDIRGTIASGTFDQSGYDGGTIGYIVSDVVTENLEVGNQSQAEADLDFLISLPGASDYTVAGACYAVATTGNQRAFNILRGKLEAEKSKAIAKVASMRESRPDILRPYVSSMALDEVVTACEENGTPPDTWIDEYAIDAEQRWKLLLITLEWRNLIS